MANALYMKARQGFLSGDISWSNHSIKAVLVDTGLYTPNIDTNQYLADIPSAARVAISGALTGKTAENGYAGAASLTIPAVSGATCEAIVLFRDTGSLATSQLIAFIDTNPGLPLVPNGGDVNLHWNTTGNKIFRI